MTDIGLDAASSVRPRSAGWKRVRDVLSTDRLVWLAIALVWMLGHGYVGIEHDARIYLGRAVADLDPAGVGRDMMFEFDGQSSFTLFRFVAKTLVATFGLGPAAALLTIVNLLAWFAAIVVLVRTIVPGRAAMLVLLVAFVLPRFYTPWHLIEAGESVPIPRPLAEAGVLLAMAALIRGRIALGLGCLVAAALVHPIMAAPGFVVFLLVLGWRDRRWFVAAAAAAGLVLAAAALGAPVVSRLFVTIDPVWRAILVERNPYLWLNLWTPSTYGMLIVQAATISTACVFLDLSPRRLFLAALATGVLGALASLAFGDGLSSLLVVQAQLWRALWLPAVLAPVAVGICAWRLPACGPYGYVALALLALAWVAVETVPLGPLAAVAALTCVALGRRRPAAIGHRYAVGVASVCVFLILVFAGIDISILREVATKAPNGAQIPWATTSSIGVAIWPTGLVALPVVVLAFAWWRWHRAPATQAVACLAVVVLAGLAAMQWDSRQPLQVVTDNGRPMPELRAMLAPRAGDVLWLRRDEVWTWAGRPNWVGYTQGGAIVFSRPLAVEWHERAKSVVEHGLAKASLLSPWIRDRSTAPVDFAKADIAGFCRRSDAPAWIVAPIAVQQPTPDIPGLRLWTPGFVDRRLVTSVNAFQWSTYDRYAVIPCAGATAAHS